MNKKKENMNYQIICRNIAKKLHVNPIVHSHDYIFQFLIEGNLFKTKKEAIEYYFTDGASSASNLDKILKDICGYTTKPIHLLEFASGYGCVTRHLKSILPHCITTSCDIHVEAIKFLWEKLNTKAILSATQPENLTINKKFDVVFALSFFSHMPKTSFSHWLLKLSSFVKPGGYLIFTTHGLASQKKYFSYSQLDEEGFYFAPSSEQKDLPTSEYGTTISTPFYVLNRVTKIPYLELKFFQEGYWWAHQDVYVLKRTSTPYSLYNKNTSHQPTVVFFNWLKMRLRELK